MYVVYDAFSLKDFFDSSVPCSFSTNNIQKYLRNEAKWDVSYPFSASSSTHSLSWVKEQLSSHTRLVYVVKGCLCNHFQSQLQPKEQICQAAAGALQTIPDIWRKFKLTYVRAGNKETAGKYDSCYP